MNTNEIYIPGTIILDEAYDSMKIEFFLDVLISKLRSAKIALIYFENITLKWSKKFQDRHSLSSSGINFQDIPSDWIHIERSVHGESFLMALGAIAKILKRFGRLYKGNSCVESIEKDFSMSFLAVWSLNDTSRHIDQRVADQITKSEGQIKGLVLSSFIGATTMQATSEPDSKVGTLEITEESLIKAQEIIQKLINCFEWAGPDRKELV